MNDAASMLKAEVPATMELAPWWKLWANPIFIKYCRVRLRKKKLAVGVSIVGVLTTFVFLIIYLSSTERASISGEGAARATLIPLFVIQGVLLMLLGTGSVASGIIQEREEGTMDYHRLTPLSPMAKIVGYLFGLPVREYALFLVTVPFLVFALIQGRVPIHVPLAIYTVFLSCVMLYHMTGFVAGMVVKSRKFAGRLAQGMVILLYLILPQFSQLGFFFFEYLTIRPVIVEQVSPLLPGQLRSDFGSGHSIARANDVPFFFFDLSPLAFSLVTQSILLVAFFVVVYRKWKNPSLHSFGKFFGVIFFGVIMLFLLGNLLPSIDQISRGVGALSRLSLPMVAPLVMLLVSFLSLGLAFLVISIITPDRFEYIRGLRRMRKLNLKRVPLASDYAGSRLHTAMIAVMTVITTVVIILALSEANLLATEFTEHGSPYRLVILLPLLLFTFQGVLEHGGLIRLVFFALFAWIVPFMVALILGVVSNDLVTGALYLAALSPLASVPFTVLGNGADLAPTAQDLMHLSRSVNISIVLHLAGVVILQGMLARRRKVLSGEVARQQPPLAG